MIQKKSDDAVSPVIGVMLMVVITVVIAAVITMFATGMVTDTEPAPVAALDVKIYNYYQALPNVGGPDFHITHLSGDPIDTRDIEIRLSWNCGDDECYVVESDSDFIHTTNKIKIGGQHYSTYSADRVGTKLAEITEYTLGKRIQPMYVKTHVSNNMRKDYGSNNLDYYFGDVILTPGLKLTASADFLGDEDGLTQTGSPYMDFIFNNGIIVCEDTGTSGYHIKGGIIEHLKPGTAVDVMIIHLPSNKAIYDNTVVVQ